MQTLDFTLSCSPLTDKMTIKMTPKGTKGHHGKECLVIRPNRLKGQGHRRLRREEEDHHLTDRDREGKGHRHADEGRDHEKEGHPLQRKRGHGENRGQGQGHPKRGKGRDRGLNRNADPQDLVHPKERLEDRGGKVS